MVISPNQRRMSRRPVQLPLPAPRTWGGRRSGAGRKVTPGRRPGVPHLRRPPHVAARPVHVTLRAVEAICCLRAAHVFPHVRRALAVSSREDFRIDHVHLIAEADTGRALSSGVRGLAIRIARVVNRALGRSGRIWGDRYHARALTTPRAVRKRPRLCIKQFPEAFEARDRNRSVLLCRMVYRVERTAGSRCERPAARRGRANMTCACRLAPTRRYRIARTAEVTLLVPPVRASVC